MGATFQTSNPFYLGNRYCENHNSGWNYFDFDNHYEWDGTSNLVFDFSYYNENSSTSNPSIALDQTTFDATTISLSSSTDLRYNQPAANFIKSAGSYRQTISNKYSRPALEDTIVACSGSIQLDVRNGQWNNTYAWSSVNGLSSTTSNLTVSGSDLVYLASEDNNLCLVKDTVQVFSSSVTTPVITASSTDFCEGETITLSTTLPADHTLQWSTSSSSLSITVSDGGDYSVTVTNEYGCSSTSADVEITEIEKPVIFTSEFSSQIYFNQQHTLTPDDGSVQSISSFNHLFDYDGKKYFVSRYQGDSANFVNVVNSNSLANLGVIQSEVINKVFMAAHEEKYNTNSSLYPYYILTGARWDGVASIPRWIDGSTSTFHDFYDQNPSNYNYYFLHYYSSNDWDWTSSYNSWSYGGLIYYNKSDLELQNGSVVCDSVQLFAPSIFDSFTWSTGDTTESIWVSGTGSHSVYVSGSYEKSDGASCSLTSDTYTFTINSSPSLTITNESGTEDLDGSNTIELEASYTTGSSISWSTGAVADSILVTTAGAYSATVELNGCSTTKTVNIYEPIYVAKTGDDTNGDGSFSSPYLTIQKGIEKTYYGQKIYVLNCNYEEGDLDFEVSSGVYKSVYIASDFVRLNDTSAIASTIIDADGSEYLIDIRGANSSTIQGFTLTGQAAGSSWECALIRLNSGASLTFKDLIIRDNTSISNQQEAQVMNIRYQSYPRFENVVFKNNASNSAQSRKTAFIYSNAGADFINCTWEDNYSWESVVRIQQNSRAYFENNLFIDNGGGDWGVVDIHENNCEVTFVNSTIVNNLLGNKNLLGIGSGYTNIRFINSVFGKAETGAKQIRNSSATTNVFEARNSVLPYDTISGALNPTQITWDVDGSNVFADPQLDIDGTLKDNSPAIGIGTKQPVTIGSTTYTPPTTDLAGVTRPNPAGSNPDAGAYESDKAQGDFDVLLTQCGYLLEATVLNSNAYSVEWLYNNSVVSTQETFTASALGTYTVNISVPIEIRRLVKPSPYLIL